jgi:hypothetical protein
MVTASMLSALTLIGENPDHSVAVVIGRTREVSGPHGTSRVIAINWRTMLGLVSRGLVSVRRETLHLADGTWDVGLTDLGRRVVAR